MSGSNDGLPPGWEMSVDPNTGRQYYVNHETMQTSWSPPLIETPLPSGWEQQRDAEGRIFFVNHLTQTTQWEDPRLSDDQPSASSTVSYPTLESSSSSVPPSSASPASSNEWSCSACTFANPLSADKCSMCDNPRPGGASPSPTTTTSAYQGSDEIDEATAAAIAAAQAEDDLAYAASIKDAPHATKPEDLLPYMVPDEHSLVCTLCAKPFDWRVRKHHCRCSGSLCCHDCTSRKVKFSLPGQKEQDRRVCDLCYDHQSAGDKHCYMRYIGILRDAGSARQEDRMLALQGIAEMIEKLPDAMQDTASIEQQSQAMRTLDMVQRCGGAATLCEMLNSNDPSDVQIQSCRIIACMAATAVNSAPDSEAPLSRSSLCNELSQGSESMTSIAAMLSRSSTPWEAHMHLAHALYLLGDLFEIQEAARTMRILPALCEALLASQEQLQSWATMAVARLIDNNEENIKTMLDANGMQALVLLLSSDNITIKEHAADAICSGLEVKDPYTASRVRDAMVNFGGATASVALLRSDSPTIARSGLKLIQYMCDGPSAEVVRAAGAVALVVALLASRDEDCQSRAVQILRNVSVCSDAGSQEVLESGGLSMSMQLLGSPNAQTKGAAASLCEVFSGDERGASIIMDSGGVPALVGLLRYPENSVRAPAAGSLVRLLEVGPREKQAVVSAGGVEALLQLEGSNDPHVLKQLVGAVYSFVSDEALLQTLTQRLSPPTLAMKLLGMLSNAPLDSATIEMLLLVVAVLCGARQGDELREEENDDPVSRQTRDLVSSNGTPLILPLLASAHQQPALVLAVFRVLLSVCGSPTGARNVVKAGGITAVVRALDDSLHVEGHNVDTMELVLQLRLYGVTLFGRLCGGKGSDTLSQASADDIRRGVRAITKVLDQQSNSTIKQASIKAIRNLSSHSGNWETIASLVLPQLIEMLLADDSAPELLSDIASIISNLAKLEKHCDTVLEAGALFALMNLLNEKEAEAVEAGLSTLAALAESSRRCRLAMVDQGAAAKLLHIAEQRADPLPECALKCLKCLTQEPANAAKITSESGSTDSLLRLVKARNEQVGQLALEILLAVAKDSENLWEQLVINADIDSSIALLKLGPPRVQGQAVSTIAALCGDSPGFALCASPTIVEVLPLIVKLLSPPEHLGADKSESPAKEAASACGMFAGSPIAREHLLTTGVLPALVSLMLRERRLGRPRSATSEHTLNALLSFSSSDEDEGDTHEHLWNDIHKLNKRRDVIDAIITVLDAHIRDTSPTPSGCDRLELCQNAIVLLGRIPGGSLTANEVTILARSARGINLLMTEAGENFVLMKECLNTLSRIAQEKSAISVLIAAGSIRSVSQLLEPLTLDASELTVPLEPSVILEAGSLVASLVHASKKDRSVDDAIVGTKAIPALAALITRTEELFPAKEHAELALTAGLESISALAQGGVAVQKAIMSTSGTSVLPALIHVGGDFDHEDCSEDERLVFMKRAKHAMLTLSRLSTIDEHRSLIVKCEPSTLQVCLRVLQSTPTEAEEHIGLVGATINLLADLGPAVVECEESGQLVGPLISNVFNAAVYRDACMTSCLSCLETFALDQATAMLLNHDVLQSVGEVLPELKKGEDIILASGLLKSLCGVPEIRSMDNLRSPMLKIIMSLIAERGDVLKLDSQIDGVVLINVLTALNMMLLQEDVRQEVRKSSSLVRSIRSLASSGDVDAYLSHTAAKVFYALGTGEKIIKRAATVAKVKIDQPKVDQPPPIPKANGVSRTSSASSKGSSPSLAPQTPPPKLPSSSPLLGASSRNSLGVQQPRPPPPPMPASSGSNSSLLPTYSRTVGQQGLRSSGGASADMASLELAKKLQMEEQRKASSNSSRKPVPAAWSCAACTFENKATSAKCEMCSTAKPAGAGSTSTPPSYSASSSSNSATVHVRCPQCFTTLGAPAASKQFKCMQCGTTSFTAQHKV